MVADEEFEVSAVAEPVALADVLPESVGLEAESAPAEPLVLAHFFDEDLLGGSRGLIFAREVGEEGLEFLRVFASNEHGRAGCKPVGQMIEAGFGFTCFRLRPATFLRIQFIRFYLAFCGHDSSPNSISKKNRLKSVLRKKSATCSFDSMIKDAVEGRRGWVAVGCWFY